MAIPSYEELMLPILKYLSDGKEHARREVIEQMVLLYKLSDDERRQLLPSGSVTIIDNRVGWAVTYQKKAGLITQPKRGILKISDRGSQLLKNNPSEINSKFLEQYPEFIEFQTKRDIPEKAEVAEERTETPEETLERGFEQINQNLAQDILIEVKKASPSFFEKLVIELLLKMGYGGSRKDAGEAIGRSGDEGIDGIIKEDKLGLDTIYIQAKRWEGTVGRPEIHKFVGALQGQRANKGIFITTSSFSKEAKEYKTKIDTNIILIDGEQLVKLMIENNIGVTTANTFEIKKIDHDYFGEE